MSEKLEAGKDYTEIDVPDLDEPEPGAVDDSLDPEDTHVEGVDAK